MVAFHMGGLRGSTTATELPSLSSRYPVVRTHGHLLPSCFITKCSRFVPKLPFVSCDFLTISARLPVTVCSVVVVSSVVVMFSHLTTNTMRFYFFQSKCVVIMTSARHFTTSREKQCKSVRRSYRFPRLKFENFKRPVNSVKFIL